MTSLVAPFARVLVANRGEIALRIIRACHEMGMEAVAVYSDADSRARHVRDADLSVRLGPAPASESYLRGDAIIAAARDTGAQAIHPGYGFLAERASFAEAVADAGLTWVGPDHRTIGALGDKLAARRTAAAADVPVVPGTLEPAPVDRADQMKSAITAAEAIGFPILVKAAAGGGGRGMRRVERSKDLPAALVAGSREAESAFGDGSVYLEREILPVRHIEVQLLGDVAGQVVALGERDCSIQRRHQKLVEEAPAPGLTGAQRRDLHSMAVRVASAAGLRNAATAEFLYDTDGQFWFLEVNTRLQVEHGVTELVAGLDIVHEQFWLAAGAPLSSRALAAAARATTPDGHAIELRISAEDPAREFAPSPGRVSRWVMPAGPGVRIDTAIESGERIPPDYDPLIAKLMVHGADRNLATSRLRRALAETDIGGVQTTLPFDRFVVGHPSFQAADLSTSWLADHWDGPGDRSRAVDRALLAAGLAALDPQGDAVSAGSAATSGIGDRALLRPPGSNSIRAEWLTSARAEMSDRWPR